MINKFIRGLTLAASLVLLPTSLFAADLNSLTSSSVEKVSSATTSVKKASTTAAAATKISSIDVNSASLDQLTSISGVGPKTAQSIIDYRDQYGDFTDLKDLVNVKGIGASTLEKIMPYLSL
ncbi:helix-hairpin-helix domain-containing protein [Psychromonas arctica]|uniref:Helix-hairpin-helix domain-containing protein n=1 Tax=Psychromonas arctica TaxID=168275 RepID=A0ABU9H6U2_9GAMM